MVKTPPTFLVTTPESLYLLVTAQRSRAALDEVRTVIVDEIHALARDKRGSHLALTLERLEHLQQGGASAADRPLRDAAADRDDRAPARPDAVRRAARIVDCGHRRDALGPRRAPRQRALGRRERASSSTRSSTASPGTSPTTARRSCS